MFDPTAKCVLVPPSSSMRQCIDTYGIEGEGEWVNNTISRNAQFWSCGMMSRGPFVPMHDHDLNELAHCHKLANEAAAFMDQPLILLRSSAEPETHPYFVAAQRGAVVPTKVDESLIRTALGDTLHSEASVVIEPLTEDASWWQEVVEDVTELVEGDADQFSEWITAWRKLLAWFPTNGLADPSFVRTKFSSRPSLTRGCVFPCFFFGISDGGSLVGVATHVVL